MKVYIVIEDSRGEGPSILGVFANRDAAEWLARDNRYAFIVEEQVL